MRQLRLVVRLLTQVVRVIEVNGRATVTPEVVATARASLVAGVDRGML